MKTDHPKKKSIPGKSKSAKTPDKKKIVKKKVIEDIKNWKSGGKKSSHTSTSSNHWRPLIHLVYRFSLELKFVIGYHGILDGRENEKVYHFDHAGFSGSAGFSKK